MPEPSLRQDGLPTDYYAPDYKIEVEGRQLNAETKGDVLEMKVSMDLENLTGFDLTINNWDDRNFGLKYSDADTFDVGNRIHLQMGYTGKPLSMAQGIITSLTPQFPESGSPTLVVSGLDSLVKLRDRKPAAKDVKRFTEKSDSEIAQIVASRNKLKFKSDSVSRKDEVVTQGDRDEAQFLKWLAARNDFDCFIGIDPDSGEETLFFIKPTDGRDGRRVRSYVFEWGKSLVSFSPQLTISKQVGCVEVRGWDPRTKQPISYKAGPSDLPGTGGGGLSGPQAAQERLGDKCEIIINQPVTSAQEARDLAISRLRERSYEYITGKGQVIGLPDLRPGDNLELQGLGRRFSGVYYVLKVEHALGNSGYQTRFDVRKPFDGGTK
jgi:phage protein D